MNTSVITSRERHEVLRGASLNYFSLKDVLRSAAVKRRIGYAVDVEKPGGISARCFISLADITEAV